MTTRRTFLAATAATLAASAKSLSTVGVQLYTVRNILPQKPLETLKALEQIGYRECEAVARDIDKIWSSLQQTALKPVSVHLDTALFMKNQAQLPAALDDAAKRGFKYVVCPYVAPADRGGADVMKKLGETLNGAGQKAKAAGMTLAYHNHAFEFEPSGNGTLLDVLMSSCDPKLVQLELDIMWVKVGGADPVAMLQKYKGRIPLMHVKNLQAGVEKRFNEKVPPTAFAEAGKGVIDIPAVLKAAGPAGVKHFFVEQDQTPGDPVASLRESFQYVHALKF
ncbi:MAG: TIM barrel protein [Acidobacteria bacterium]|nr:TIM barrel protein [Acidobacteriota bacterium]